MKLVSVKYRKLMSKTNLKQNFKMNKIRGKRAQNVRLKSPLSINTMPNEILLEIFSHLQHKDMLNATLVNRNWNNLISNTRKTTRKINKILVAPRNVEQGFPKITRRYEEMEIEEITEWTDDLFAYLRTVGPYITRLQLFECVFFDDDFIRLLKCFENLSGLEIWECHPGISPVQVYSMDEIVTLDHLSSLAVRGYSWPMRLINTPRLLHLEVLSLSYCDQEWLINFLNRQTRLEVLHLIDIFDLFDSRFGALNFNCDLKELLLYDLVHIDYNQFFNMLDRVKSSVKTVDIGYLTRRKVTEFILMNFEALNILSIDCNCLPSSSQFYQQLRRNDSLQAVTIFGFIKSTGPVLNFLRKHPAINILRIKALNNLHSKRFTFWNEFSKNTPNVSFLYIGNLESYNMVYMKSSKLRHLDVDFIGQTNVTAWTDFCKNNPNIESICVFRRPKHIDSEVEGILYKYLPKLRDIHVLS